jgi:hypothetical protein
MFRRLIVVTFALVLAACGGGDGITLPATIDAEGTWSGTFPPNDGGQDVSLTMALTETDGAVTGTGTLVTSAGSFPLTITGTYDSPRLALAITTPGFDPVSLVAIVGAQSMTGTIGGGGFSNEIVTLDRQ